VVWKVHDNGPQIGAVEQVAKRLDAQRIVGIEQMNSIFFKKAGADFTRRQFYLAQLHGRAP
jgi:hypothetical protein